MAAQSVNIPNMDLIEADTVGQERYAALSFKGGTASSHFAFPEPSDSPADAWDGEEAGGQVEIFQANRAFWQIAKQYLLDAMGHAIVHEVFLDPSATMVALNMDDATGIIESLGQIFSINPEKAAFEAAKREAFRGYMERFSNPLFRFMHKILEQTEANKSFSYTQFTNDFEVITYDEFVDGWNRLVVPENATLCVMGSDVNAIADEAAKVLASDSRQEVIPIPSKPCVPLDRDMEIAIEGPTLFELGALSFGMLDGFVPMEKLFCLELVNEHLFNGAGTVSVDTMDASIVFAERIDEDLLHKGAWMIEEGGYASCIQRFTDRLTRTAIQHPFLYVAEQARGTAFGMNRILLQSIANRIPYGAFREKLEAAFRSARQIRMTQGPMAGMADDLQEFANAVGDLRASLDGAEKSL